MDPTTFDPGPPAPVDARPEGDGWTLVFVRDLHHPLERVWEALTDPARLDRWAPWTADRDVGTTGEVTLTMRAGAEPSPDDEPMTATVTVADPPSVLEYTLGGDRIRWELVAAGAGTRLTLRHTVESRDVVPKVAAGWHLCFAVLDRLLAGEDPGPIRGAEAMDFGWQRLHDAYAERLGIDVGA